MIFSEPGTKQERLELMPEEWSSLTLDSFFESLDVDDLKLNESTNVIFSNGVEFQASLQYFPLQERYNISFSLLKGADQIQADVDFFSSNQLDVIINIRRQIDDASKRMLPKGVGIELYKKILNLLQQFSKINSKKIYHEIIVLPKNGMDWKKVFEPVITEYGYEGPIENLDGVSYAKTYKPEDSE